MHLFIDLKPLKMYKISLITVAILLSCSCTIAQVAKNIAKGKPAKQSSTYPHSVAGMAVDGNKKACSHTKKEKHPWWQVDLGKSYDIERVKITNRVHYSHRLKNFDVTVGSNVDALKNQLCVHRNDVVGSGATITLECSFPIPGRYVSIILKGSNAGYLTLCEVEVFASETPASMVNLAKGRPTEQSSTKYGGVSSRAVDGNLNSIWKEGSCTYTKVQVNPWLEVKLEKEYVIGHVRLTNRGDCCGKRLSNIEIRVGNVDRNPDANKLCVKHDADITQAQSKELYCTVPVSGKYVYVVLRKKHLLTICELEVFLANIARGKKTKQSSILHGGPASRIVDGNTNSNYHAGSCMHTNQQRGPWVMIDLGKSYLVNEVVIYARGDCCGFTLNNFDIRVGLVDGKPNHNPLCLHYPGGASKGQVLDLPCRTPRNGRYVFLWLRYPNNYQYITICEMKVYSY